MSKQPIKENEFFPAPGGTAGGISYQPGSWAGTAASAEVSQNPHDFQHADDNKAVNQSDNLLKNNPESGSMASKVDSLYADTSQAPITPDEVVTGIKYELGQQIKKDKRKAKEEVAKNLKTNHKFYSSLAMLNVTDRDMVNNMSENKQHPNDAPARLKITPNVEETKKIFAEMMKSKETKYVVNSKLVDVMQEMWEQKKARRLGSN
jgi:hypothetical protein